MRLGFFALLGVAVLGVAAWAGATALIEDKTNATGCGADLRDSALHDMMRAGC